MLLLQSPQPVCHNEGGEYHACGTVYQQHTGRIKSLNISIGFRKHSVGLAKLAYAESIRTIFTIALEVALNIPLNNNPAFQLALSVTHRTKLLLVESLYSYYCSSKRFRAGDLRTDLAKYQSCKFQIILNL